ncbi:MAG: DUF4012 domain-containing protein [Acidimicrobiales bacterium]
MAETDLELTSGEADDNNPAGSTPTAGSRRRAPRRKLSRRVKVGIWVFIAIVILWLIASALLTVMGLRDASQAMKDLQRAKSEVTASQVISDEPQQALKEAQAQFSNASGLLDSPVLSPMTIVPILGRQVTSVRDLAHAATQVSGVGYQAISQLRTVLNAPHKSGPARVTALQNVANLASNTDARLASISLGPSTDLIGPIASRYNQFSTQLQQVKTRLYHASAVAGSLGEILHGPSTYLLLVSNNAEMRAGEGMFLDAGSLSISDGHVQLGTLVDTGAIEVPAGAVPVTGDLAARWGWLLPSQDWRNLGVTPNFEEIGPVASSMWQAVEHQQVQGVMSIDVQALEELLQVTGPVTLPDGTVVSSSNVVEFLLHDEYENLSITSTNAQVQRESRLGALAKATLQALQDRSLDLNALATAMSDATSGRHIMLWSASAAAENSWTLGGVSGELPSNSVMAAVLNRSGAKLDPYLSVSCSLTVQSTKGSSQGTLSVSLDNQTPPDQSSYIAGPYPHLGTVYGEYVGFVAVNLPADASPHFYATGASGSQVAWGAEGPVWVLAVPVDVKMGRHQTVTVHFMLPGNHGSMVVQPSARIPPELWSFRGKGFTDATPYTVSW